MPLLQREIMDSLNGPNVSLGHLNVPGAVGAESTVGTPPSVPSAARELRKAGGDEIHDSHREHFFAELNAARRLAESTNSAAAWLRAASGLMLVGEQDAAAASAVNGLAQSVVDGQIVDSAAFVSSLKILSQLDNFDSTGALSIAASAETPSEYAQYLLARFAVQNGDQSRAARLLRFNTTLSGMNLRGYLYACAGKLQEAAHQFRKVLREDPSNVDAYLNLAWAFRELGSVTKAVRMMRAAWQLSPGRRDVAIAFVETLTAAKLWDEQNRLLDELKQTDLAESVPFLVASAGRSTRAGRSDRARSQLVRAKEAAQAMSDEVLSAELDANIVLLDWQSSDASDPVGFFARLASLSDRAPSSVIVAELASRFADRASQAAIVSKIRLRLDDTSMPQGMSSLLRAVDVRLALLEARFDDALRLLAGWLESEPRCADALLLSLWVRGHCDGDWASAAMVARRAIAVVGPTRFVCNQGAYAFAMNGEIKDAEQLVEVSPGSSYQLDATHGLVDIFAGRVAEGLRRYRRALERLEDSAAGADHDASLMYIHQALLLKRLGLSESDRALVRAAALAEQPLPADWRGYVVFQMLASAARKAGEEWPPTLE